MSKVSGKRVAKLAAYILQMSDLELEKYLSNGILKRDMRMLCASVLSQTENAKPALLSQSESEKPKKRGVK